MLPYLDPNPVELTASRLASLEQTHLIPSRTLNPHARFYVREMRILAYSQLLESYRSLTLESLSRAFGVSVDFVDACVDFFSLPLTFQVDGFFLASFHDSSQRVV